MNWIMSKYLNGTALYLFLFMLGLDFAFIALHITNFFLDGLLGSAAYIDRDRGYAEIFQYIKLGIVFLTLLRLSSTQKSLLYLAWSNLFAYIAVDDSFQVHERLGTFLAHKLGFEALFYLRGVDFGELLVFAVSGCLLLGFIIFAHWLNDNPCEKRNSCILVSFLGTLSFFGIGVDMLHIAAPAYYADRGVWTGMFIHSLALLEDGGEMLILSMLTWFVLQLYFSYQKLKKDY